MGLSWQHLLIFLVIALLLFGRGKISELMGDVAKGIKSFKKGMADDEDVADAPANDADAPRKAIQDQRDAAAPATTTKAADRKTG